MTTSGYLTLLSDLLVAEDVVCIPDFGGFLTKYKSAQVDQVNGIIDPPTKYIAFNEDLKDDGGKLMNYLQSRPEIDIDAYRMSRFVNELKSDLDAHQVIVIPKIGRLYKDYEGHTHFMPNLDNLNNQSYGLPRLKYTPRLRQVPRVVEASPAIRTTERSADKSYIKGVTQAAAVLALCFLGYLGIQQSGGNSEGQIANTATEMNVIESVIDSPIIGLTPAESKAETTEPLVNVRTSIIMIGAFGNSTNVDRLVRKIEADDYQPYVDQRGQLQRVGIEVSYADDEGLNAYLRDIRSSYTPSAWVLD